MIYRVRDEKIEAVLADFSHGILYTDGVENPPSLYPHSVFDHFGEALILCIAVPYQHSQLLKVDQSFYAGTSRAVVEPFSWETDYHVNVRSELQMIHKKTGYCREPVYCVDNSGFNDREVALYADLGRIGKNNLLIHPVFGTKFFIGYLIYSPWKILSGARVTPAVLEEKTTLCEGCRRCQSACPTQALTNGMDRCISYLTQCKEPISDELKLKMGRQLYGCSICQEVCPYNMPTEGFIDSSVDPFEILDLTNRAFRSKYGHMGFAWRPLWVYKRNALIVIGNTGDVAARGKLLERKSQLLEHEKLSSVFRWAVAQITLREE